ncbi:MAG: hypothetical protein WAK17_29235 [Candidatus Nitrosopolaris sp.]
MDIWKEKNTEYSSSLINNKRIGGWTRLITGFVAVTMISSVFLTSQPQDELLAKKSTGNKSGVDSPVDQTHCDQKGYPSCYNVGYSDGQNAPGTSCPSGHSEAYCNGYEAASLSGNSTSDAGTTIRSSPFNSGLSIKQNQAGQSSSNINLTNSPNSNVNSKSSISNNAKENSNIINEPYLSSLSSVYSGPSPPPLFQSSKNTINQGASNNANININNSSGTISQDK